MRFNKPTTARMQELIDHSTTLYGEEMFQYGEFKSLSTAAATAQAEVHQHLHNNQNVLDNFFYELEDEKTKQSIGYIWFRLIANKDQNNRYAFLAYIYINADQRRKGYAEKAMRRYETLARTRGAKESLLNVFMGNTAAIHFYKKLGYIVIDETGYYEAKGIKNTRWQMVKPL